MTALLTVAAAPALHCCRVNDALPCLACLTSKLSRPGKDACPICSQRRDLRGLCPNELCRSPRRRIARIHAVGYQSGQLRRAINSYKYRGVAGWSAVFGCMLLAWLDANMAADPPDLIVANPSFVGPGGQDFAHAEAVLADAARADPGSRWPFDTRTPAAILKTHPTAKSANAEAWSKRVAGYELRDALTVTAPDRTAGRFIVVYDDICTTGTQLNAVADCLIGQAGAARVEGLVLARAPWRGEGKLTNAGAEPATP
jgi:predicted amidophosphoribosyltransferase